MPDTESAVPAPTTPARPAASDLHVGDVVQIHEGPFAPRTGLIHGLTDRHVHLRMPNMWRRDIIVTVPIPAVAEVTPEWRAAFTARLRPDRDPLAYIAQQIGELRARGLESFNCVDPMQHDFQIRMNWIWWTGALEEEFARGVGFKPMFAVNVWAHRVPVLLMSRDAFRRAMRTQGNLNLIPAEFFKESIPKSRRKQVQDVRLCYRGRKYNPQDLWAASKTPYENHAWYQFRRGHLIPPTIQFVTVPELGVELDVEVKRARTPGKARLVSTALCYALPLVPLPAFRYIHVSRWGLLSPQFNTLGPRPVSLLAGMGSDQAESFNGGDGS